VQVWWSVYPFRWCWPNVPVDASVRHRPATRLAGRLIIALGLLVDDAMIAVENEKVKLEQGFSRCMPPPSPMPARHFRC